MPRIASGWDGKTSSIELNDIAVVDGQRQGGVVVGSDAGTLVLFVDKGAQSKWREDWYLDL